MTLPLRPLPQVQSSANYAWREGWWQGIAVGFVTGLACSVIVVLK
jgi:hypothetical protein